MRNLQTTFPDRPANELREILDDCWSHFGREALIYIRMQTMSLEEIAARCPFADAAILEEASARGKGVVLISAHFGGWEVGGLALTALVENVRIVTRPLDNEYLEAEMALTRA